MVCFFLLRKKDILKKWIQHTQGIQNPNLKSRNFDFILVYFLNFSLFIVSSSTPTGILCSSIVKKGRNFTFSRVPKTPQLRPPTSCSAGPKVQNTGTSEGQRTNNVNPEGKNEKSARKCRPFQLQFIDGMTRHQIIYS